MIKVTKKFWYSLIFGLVIILDRITKLEALATYMQRGIVNDWLSFEVSFNRGISWSMFHSQHVWVFTTISLIIVGITLLLGVYAYARWLNKQTIIGEVLVLAGSVSNIIDRVLYGGVVDFIILSYKDWVFPAFNVADVAIVCGVGIMLLEYYKES